MLCHHLALCYYSSNILFIMEKLDPTEEQPLAEETTLNFLVESIGYKNVS